MASKRHQTGFGEAPKRQRRVIDLETKQKVIEDYKAGKGVILIARDLGMSSSTITTILKNKKKLTQAISESASLKITRLSKMREGPISDMEKLLMIWIEDQTQKGVSLTTTAITNKALGLFETLKEKAGPDYNVKFRASSGWFKRFKQRFSLDNVETTPEFINTDVKDATHFVDILDKLIAENEYLPQQIFNIDEISLFWKYMPEKILIQKGAKIRPEFKAYSDRITVLLGGNVVGFKLKPFVIWNCENPSAFKSVNKHTLPVYYRRNEKIQMTQQIFQDAVLNCYANEIEKYCLKEKIPFKILLIIDNAPEHPPFIGELHPNIKVAFIPPNTTSLIQPMNQGIAIIFKAYYLRRTFAQAAATTSECNWTTLTQFWKTYNIYHCIKNIAWAWDDVTSQYINASWKKILKKFFQDIKEFDKDEEVAKVNKAIVDLANELKLRLDEDDIDKILEVNVEELTDSELWGLEQERLAEEEYSLEEDTPKKFTLEGLTKFFVDLNELLKSAEEMDPNTERFSLIERNAHAVFTAYKEIYNEKKKQANQTSLDIFRKQATFPRDEAHAGPSCTVKNEFVFLDEDSAHFENEIFHLKPDIEMRNSDSDESPLS